MTDRAVNPLMAVMVEFSTKTLQPGKAFQRSGLCVRVTDRADRAAAAYGKLVLMATDTWRVAAFAGKANVRRIAIPAMTEQTGHSHVSRICVKESREVQVLYLCQRLAHRFDDRICSGFSRPRVTKEAERCHDDNKRQTLFCTASYGCDRRPLHTLFRSLQSL